MTTERLEQLVRNGAGPEVLREKHGHGGLDENTPSVCPAWYRQGQDSRASENIDDVPRHVDKHLRLVPP